LSKKSLKFAAATADGNTGVSFSSTKRKCPMRRRWLLHGIVACAVCLGAVQLAEAQSMAGSGTSGGAGAGSGSGSGVGTGSGIGTGSGVGTGAGVGTGSGVGTGGSSSGSGVATLGSTTNLGAGLGGGPGGTTASTTVPAKADPYSSTYSNPYAIGLNGVFTTYNSKAVTGSGFGKAVYVTTTTTATTTGGASSTTTTNTGGWSTLGIPKSPAYVTVLSEDIPIVAHAPAQLQSELLKSLEQAPFLKDKKGIFLAVDGSTVFLKGQVASARERRVVEGVVRLTPGVRDVVNELVPILPPTKQ
jgi:hypothetical protein